MGTVLDGTVLAGFIWADPSLFCERGMSILSVSDMASWDDHKH
jgi:hypothetical protein